MKVTWWIANNESSSRRWSNFFLFCPSGDLPCKGRRFIPISIVNLQRERKTLGDIHTRGKCMPVEDLSLYIFIRLKVMQQLFYTDFSAHRGLERAWCVKNHLHDYHQWLLCNFYRVTISLWRREMNQTIRTLY